MNQLLGLYRSLSSERTLYAPADAEHGERLVYCLDNEVSLTIEANPSGVQIIYTGNTESMKRNIDALRLPRGWSQNLGIQIFQRFRQELKSRTGQSARLSVEIDVARLRQLEKILLNMR